MPRALAICGIAGYKNGLGVQLGSAPARRVQCRPHDRATTASSVSTRRCSWSTESPEDRHDRGIDARRTRIRVLHDLAGVRAPPADGRPRRVRARRPRSRTASRRFDALVTEAGRADGAEVVRFPPVLSREHLERSELPRVVPAPGGLSSQLRRGRASPPDAAAQVDAGEDWTAQPHADRRGADARPRATPSTRRCAGTLPRGGRLFDLSSYCFRHEPSTDPARMQMFRMHEYVRLAATADAVREWRDPGSLAGSGADARLGLAATSQPANDPFFGRGGRMLAANQRDQELKYENWSSPIAVGGAPTAVISVNYHQDHFGQLFDIRTARRRGRTLGLPRLRPGAPHPGSLHSHGLDPAKWPRRGLRQLSACDRVRPRRSIRRGWVPHRLHGPDRMWPETNCYVDLWIELLHALGSSRRRYWRSRSPSISRATSGRSSSSRSTTSRRCTASTSRS